MPVQHFSKVRSNSGVTNQGLDLGRCATWNGTTSSLSFTIPTSFNPANLTSFSLGFWINANNAGEGGGFGNPFQLGFVSSFYDNYPGLKVSIAHSVTAASAYMDSGSLSFDAWHRVIVLWDDSWDHPLIFADGRDVTLTPTTKSGTRANVSGGTAYLGNNSAGTRTIDGEMDQVDIWNRVLTMGEIVDDWYFGTNVTIPNKIFSLPMDETTGNYIDTVGSIACTPSNLTQDVASNTTSDIVVPARSASVIRSVLFGEEDHAVFAGASSSGIDVPVSPSLTSFSVMFRMLSQEASSSEDMILSWQSNFNDDGFEIRADNNSLIFVRYNNTSASQVDGGFTADVWHTVLCTYSSGTLRLWIDGTQVDSDFFSAMTSSGSEVMRIGGRSFNHSFDAWTGKIKDFVFKNGTIWGSAEMTAYTNYRTIPSTPSVYYKFDGDSVDSSGNGNNGTDTNMTYAVTNAPNFRIRSSL